MSDEFTLAELSERTGVQPRTIRSYIEQGLMRGPEIGGRATRYSVYHLQRLQAIRTLKDIRRLPLAEVRRRLLGMSAAEIASLASESEEIAAAPPPDSQSAASALDYLRSIHSRSEEELEPEKPPQGPTPLDFLLTRLDRMVPGSRPARKARGEVWTSIPVTKDVEIRVRGEQSADRLARWERIADHLREILMGEGKEE